ncbi:hypothetical protein [Leptospira interrogans]|uniref:hypothetical protein n=1 Tax=Leptospira interrogans TaxID=173 RepID=UPI0009E258D8|nr:hypothetical protein [Leptospira interrogans]
MQKCSVGTPADLGFYNLILKCGNSYRVELQKDENLKICKDEICRNSHKSGCNKFDFESVGTPTNLICKFNFEICGNYCKPGCNSSILKSVGTPTNLICKFNFESVETPTNLVVTVRF